MPGGGASEIAASIAITRASDRVPTVEQYAMRAFADALEDIPLALSENSGLPAVEEVSRIKGRQVSESNPNLGIDAMLTGNCDMNDQEVWEAENSKVQQFRLSTQVVRMVLKIDDIIEPHEVF